MEHLPKPATYLLRVDDLCPTIDRLAWDRLAHVLVEFSIRPILAIVPDNKDEALVRNPPDPRFWEEMRSLQRGGATIAQHGYQHRCSISGRSMVPLHRMSEFAGCALDAQRMRLRAGAEILSHHGLPPRLFVAPAHGFDANTLRALRAEGFDCLSDGMTRIPFVRGGILWIPQQLWAPVSKDAGVWTICLHPNTMTDGSIANLRQFLRRNAAQFTSVERVIEAGCRIDLPVTERAWEYAQTVRHVARSWRRRVVAPRNATL